MNPILHDFPMPIRTTRFVIRPLGPGDGVILNEAVRESFPSLKEWLLWAQVIPTVEESEETVRRFYVDYIRRQAFNLGIFRDSAFVGILGFNKIDWGIGSGAIGYWCRQSALGQGVMTESVKALVSYAFQEMKLRRLTILCDDENTKSSKLAERLGFTLETRAKGLIEKPGSSELRIGRRYVLFSETVAL